MALSPQHKYFVFNGDICPIAQFTPSDGDNEIYEVLRIVQGVPLFKEDHFERFKNSAKIAGKSLPVSADKIAEMLERLIKVNNVQTGNILISYGENLTAFFIPHKYPSNEMYKEGINCGILNAERKNPNAKIFQTPVREKANKLIEEKKFYEVLLTDNTGKITEGSKSNVFFVKRDTLFTPHRSDVLLGITRQKTIQLAQKIHFKLKEADIYQQDLDRFSGAFLTGTSPKILPIRKIEEKEFDPQNVIISTLMKNYDELIQEYVKASE